MKMEVVALVCDKGSGRFNEDVASFVGRSAYVLDGATGLNNKNLVSLKSDANWLVNFWDGYLRHHVNDVMPLREIVRRGIDLAFLEYKRLLGSKVASGIDYPSAAIAIVRFNGDKLEYFILGDCAVVTKQGEKLKFYMDQRLSVLDNDIYRKMRDLHARGILEHEEVKSILIKDIISNRMQKNTLGGYWILEFVSSAVDYSLSGEIEVKAGMDVAIMTDGFSAIVDKYHLLSTSQAFEEGIDKAIFKLRNFEENDLKAVKIPRFKIKDDASCIHLRFVDK